MELFEKIRINILSFLGHFILKGIYLTCRLSESPTSNIIEETYDQETPVIVVFWHGQQLLMLGVFKEFRKRLSRSTYVLISDHFDGRIISKAIEYFGLNSVAGSSTKNAKRASLNLLKKLASGYNIAITPDGPRGPAFQAKKGAIKLAQSSGAPIITVAIQATKYWKLGSWDSMIIPKPFSTIHYHVNEAIRIDKNLDEYAQIFINLMEEKIAA